MSGHGHDLVRGRTPFGEARRRRFSQAVRRAVAKTGFVAPIPELVAEARDRERLAVCGRQER